MDSPKPLASVRLGRKDLIGRSLVGSAEASALGQADRLAAVGQLARGLAHEMNTPLGSISAHAEESIELLQDLQASTQRLEDVRGHLLAIMRQAHRCSRIATRLLQFAQPARELCESCRAEQVIGDVLRLFEPVAQAKGVRLDHSFEKDLPEAPIGPADLEQLLVNLVQNAIDACQSGDLVRVQARIRDRQLELVIEDTGSGIPAEILSRIFDPFFTTKPVGQGTGLGLSVCHGIVGSVGGSIEVTSSPHAGTRVTTTLPVDSRPTESAFAEAALSSSGGSSARRSPQRWRNRYHNAIRYSSLRRIVPGFFLLLSLSLGTGCGSGRHEAEEPIVLPPTLPVVQPATVPAKKADTEQVMQGPQLYANYCQACHGENGDGNGTAARFLYPKPRNFRESQFRLVTTMNLVPSDADLMRVLERGMPGSAMFPFAHLSGAERQKLVAHVREFAKKGLEDRLRRDAKEVGEEVDPVELATVLKTRTEPGPAVEVPRDLPAAGSESVARGRELYLKQCATCHGLTGKGDGVQEQRDDTTMPIHPRDFTRGIFKGGRDGAQLFARITLGVPGTPMPASPNLKPAEIGDIINYIHSLSDPSTPAKVEHKRTRLVARRVQKTLPDDIPETAWEAVPPSPIVVSPLWWREYEEPELRVQALHDGHSLAIRLSWHDATRNAQAVRPQDFPDMAALQLFKGPREPFLGMGAATGAVDVWLWNAAAQADLEQYADVDTAYPQMAVDMYPYEKVGEGPRLHPTERQPREFITAWAAGNLRSDPTHPLAGSHLQAQGFGSLTMRPHVSQVVQAHGTSDGERWTVLLRRPLDVSTEAGLPLAAGIKVSVAFALWDGAAGDRNGQKLVSIWHDLELE